MSSTIATDRRGNHLVSLETASTEELDAAAEHTACPLALIVLVDSATGDVLFGLNTWRHEYELPGGIVESGESFVEAARRELEEETGIRIEALDLFGYARFALTDPDRDELGAVYFAKVLNTEATASDEMQQFVWRKPLSESDLEISALDDAIAEWVTHFGEAAE
ncbi:NUDIX domain-containing protein [Microbacterium gorillae]|uniref:NUDIX domain-containing protein n=1 Tax=Microbacterium gorillae TaxID=1231063 RepID=UPI000694AC1F|nr:NUDIX domain-containing protein [Microbacterium gorillae]